jgi:hypothetical protein
MGSYSSLKASNHAGPEPNYQGRTISAMKYGIPLGWLFLFSGEDQLTYRPEEYPEDLFFFRAPMDQARTRLAEAVNSLSGDSYLWSRMRSLESLRTELDRSSEGWIEFDFEEIIFMGWGVRKILAGLKRYPAVRTTVLQLAREKRFHAVRKQLNSLKKVTGFKLRGSPWLDHLWWTFDRKFLRIPTDQELCDWYVSGGMEPSQVIIE